MYFKRPLFPIKLPLGFASQSQRGYALQEDHSFDTNNYIEKPKLHMLVNTNALLSSRQSHSPRVRYKHFLAEQLKFSSSLALRSVQPALLFVGLTMTPASKSISRIHSCVLSPHVESDSFSPSHPQRGYSTRDENSSKTHKQTEKPKFHPWVNTHALLSSRQPHPCPCQIRTLPRDTDHHLNTPSCVMNQRKLERAPIAESSVVLPGNIIRLAFQFTNMY